MTRSWLGFITNPLLVQIKKSVKSSVPMGSTDSNRRFVKNERHTVFRMY